MSGDRNHTPSDRSELRGLLDSWKRRQGVSFSVGVPGAVAEFHAMPGEDTSWSMTDDALRGQCSGGTIKITLRDDVLAAPFDLASRRPGRRIRGVLFCLRASEARMTACRVLRHAGRNGGDADLFDIGAGAATLEALVMIADRQLSATLQSSEGERLVGTHHPALMAIVAASPPRLFRSALAQVTVMQPIATSATPRGPHTHLLPDLLDGSTHDPRIAVPEGWLPCLTMHVPDDDPEFRCLADRFGVAGDDAHTRHSGQGDPR